MPWQLAIALSMLALLTTSLVTRRHSQKSLAPPSFPPAISFVLGIAPLGALAGLLLPHHVHWTWLLGLLLAVVASFAALANWFNFRAIKQQPIAQYQLISQSQTVMIIILGWVVLSEKLTLYQSVGAALLLVAAILAVQAPVKNLSRELRVIHARAVILNVAGSLTGAIALVTEKASLGHMDIGAYLIFGYSAQALGLVVLASKDVTKATLKRLTHHEIKWSAFMGLAHGTSGVLYVYAIVKSDNISLIAAIGAIALPLNALAAYLILKEREKQKLLWGALAIGFAGLLIMAIQ